MQIQQRNYIVIVTLLMIVVGITFFLHRRAAYRHQIAVSKLRLLKSQFKPHFIFNLLNSIQTLISKEESEKAYQHLGEFSALMRKDLNAYEKDFITLQEEITLIEDYVRLEQLRFKERISFELKLDPILNPEKEKLPTMVIQPLVENAFQHAFSGKNQSGLIIVEFNAQSDKFLEILVKDNGVGYDKDKSQSINPSKGIQMVESRIKLVHKRNQLEIRNLLKEGKKGTEVTLKLKRL